MYFTPRTQPCRVSNNLNRSAPNNSLTNSDVGEPFQRGRYIWPDSTSQTASCLNASVYRARVAFVICIRFADCQLRDVSRGQDQNARRIIEASK
jgi:hypothetical protein